MKSGKQLRLKNYDYSSDGLYFVTIATRDRLPLLNEYIDSLNRAFDMVSADGAVLDYHVIMPDHVHFIVGLFNGSVSLSEIVRRFKARSSKFAGQRLWQPNYYEHIIRSEKGLDKIREYIYFNPHVLEIDFEAVIAHNSTQD